MAVYDRYLDELYEEWRYWGAWTPNQHLEIGMVGRLKGPDYIFDYDSDLKSYGIDFEVAHDPHPADFEHISRNSVTVIAKAEGKVDPTNFPNLGEAQAAVRFEFRKEDSVVFRAVECYEDRMRDERAIKQQIVALAEAGEWPMDAVVITEVVRAAAGTVIIGGSRNASITLQGAGEGSAGGHLDIAASADITVTSSRDIATQIVGADGLTPLFKPLKLKRLWPFGMSWSDGMLAIDGQPSPTSVVVRSATRAASRVLVDHMVSDFSPRELREEAKEG